MQSCGRRLIIHSTACFPQTQPCCPVVPLSLFQWITSDDHHYLVTQFRSLQLAYIMLLSWSIPLWKKEKFSLRHIFPSSVIFWNWLLRGWLPEPLCLDYLKSRIGPYLDSLFRLFIIIHFLLLFQSNRTSHSSSLFRIQLSISSGSVPLH